MTYSKSTKRSPTVAGRAAGAQRQEDVTPSLQDSLLVHVCCKLKTDSRGCHVTPASPPNCQAERELNSMEPTAPEKFGMFCEGTELSLPFHKKDFNASEQVPTTMGGN